MLALGAALQTLSQGLRVWNPPFGLFVFSFFLVSLGQAYQDTHANTFVAGADSAHRWLGLIHAMYMAGCLLGPVVATPIASLGASGSWCLFYAFPLGLGVLNLVMTIFAFRNRVRILKMNSWLCQRLMITRHRRRRKCWLTKEKFRETRKLAGSFARRWGRLQCGVLVSFISSTSEPLSLPEAGWWNILSTCAVGTLLAWGMFRPALAEGVFWAGSS